MTAAPARGTRRETDVQPALPSRSDSAISSRLTTSAHSTGSPTPLTSERGRSTNRYPDSLGRVPLHRRGTSNTYERLEDLLREAGYKETRVFTPETDRNARTTADGAGNTMRGSVGAVVGFIAGLVSRGSSLSRETASPKDGLTEPAWSPPPSPLAHALYIRDRRVQRIPSMSSLSLKGSSESLRRRACIDISTDPSQPTHTYQVRQLHQSSQGLPNHPHMKHRMHLHPPNNNRRHHQLNNYSSKQSPTKPNPPNARAYLRHMASAPNIQPLVKRPSLSEASLRSHAVGREHRSSMRHTIILNDEDSIAESDYESRTRVPIHDDGHQVHPPLPRNWIDSVARALLSGVGSPAAVTSDAVSTRTAKTVSTRKSSTLSDKSNRDGRGRASKRATRPPLLCVQVQDMKAKTSEGQVACTNVTCRSTPTSRANSRVRNSGRGDRANTVNRGKRGEGGKSGNRQRGKDRNAGVVPSLGRTKVDNDDWMAPHQRHTGGLGMQGSAQAYPEGTRFPDSDRNDVDNDDDDDDEDDDEDDEGELDLDRLLVPALRQHSIQSLRKHLQRPRSRTSNDHVAPHSSGLPGSGRASPFGGAAAGRPNWGDTSGSMSRGREWNRGEEDEDGYSHVHPALAAGMSRSSTKWRRGLPGLAQWTASS